MKEIAEFRVDERYAPQLFTEAEGQRLGNMVRKIVLGTDDPRFGRVGELDMLLRAEGLSFFYGWSVERRYTKSELNSASRFRLKFSATFEPAGEECGTQYNDADACPHCGAGAKQISDLRLDLRKLPKAKDIARTIADEWVVSQRLAERMVALNLTGFDLRPVRHKAKYEDDPVVLHDVPTGREIVRLAEAANAPHPSADFWVWLNRPENRNLVETAQTEHAILMGKRLDKRSAQLPTWYQFIVKECRVDITSPTRTGDDLFDRSPEKCPAGDLIGLNLLSEISVARGIWEEKDIACSQQFIGTRRGLLRPHREILISRRFRDLFVQEGFKGAKFEVANVV